ncbi:MAG: sensor histidine kinase [Gemmatimonadaceae bacterium]
MSTFSFRRGRGVSGGQTVVAVALFSLVALVFGLALHARAAERSQRRTADRALRDYASVATWQYVRHADDALHGAAAASLVPSMGNLTAAPGTQLPPPSTLLEVDTTIVTCWIAKRAKSAFLVDLRDGRIVVAGEPLGAATRNALPERVARIVRETATNRDPHRLAVDTIGGVERVISLALVRDSVAGVWAAYGVDAPPKALDTLFHTVARNEQLLPRALVGNIPNDSVIAIRVSRPDGEPFFERGRLDERFAASDTMSADQGGLIVTVSLEPRLASSLIIGGLPPSRLPALLALLILSVLLALGAFAQLRRSRELARLRNQFVANVSHELRTPLSQISMFSETLLLGRERSTDERRHFLSVIFRETRRLASLVESVLRFSRGEAGATRVRPEPRDIAAEARDTLGTFGPLAAAAGARLHSQLDDDAHAMVDPGAMRQILLNLLDNAVKYGPEGQTIVVRVVRGGDEVVVSVDDDGPGIAPADRRRVFDPFERLDRRDAPKTSGAGIGLAVVRDLVIAHAGRVWIEDAPSGGTRVSIALRAVEAPQRGDPPVPTALEEVTASSP